MKHTPTRTFHAFDVDNDSDNPDQWWAACACGWTSAPRISQASTHDAWLEHVGTVL